MKEKPQSAHDKEQVLAVISDVTVAAGSDDSRDQLWSRARCKSERIWSGGLASIQSLRSSRWSILQRLTLVEEESMIEYTWAWRTAKKGYHWSSPVNRTERKLRETEQNWTETEQSRTGTERLAFLSCHSTHHLLIINHCCHRCLWLSLFTPIQYSEKSTSKCLHPLSRNSTPPPPNEHFQPRNCS